MENINQKTPVQNNKNKLFVLLIAFLTIVIGILIWQYIELKRSIDVEVAEKVQHIEEKQALNNELENLMEEYETLQSDNGQLQSEIDDKKVQIEKLLEEAKKYQGDRAMLNKLQKETQTLRTIMKGYVRTIDSLNTLNIALREENSLVKAELGTQKNKYNDLSKEKDNLSGKVKLASQLETTEVLAQAVFYRSGGKEVDTRKAKKAEKFKCCFTVRENKVTPLGNKTFYMRITSPEGKVLAEGADESFTFSFEGTKGLFSAKKTAEYQGQLMSVCLLYNLKDNEKAEGKYIVEVFESEAKIGRTTFELK